MDQINTYVFQTDSLLVNQIYNEQPNYLIEYNEEAKKKYCIVYFSSNEIYYPNTESVFVSDIVKKNRFEWYRNRINCGYKHIFLRDIKKQWYLEGINSTLNSPEKLAEFLWEETAGYHTIMVGSSAGGFAAALFGSMINAKRILVFNGQFELQSLLSKSSEQINPTIFRQRENDAVSRFYSLKNHIRNPQNIYYFCSIKSKWDIAQFQHIQEVALNKILFKTRHHGIPFLKSSLAKVINLSEDQLASFSGRRYHPLYFSYKIEGTPVIYNLINIVFGKFIKALRVKLNKKRK